MMQEDVINGRDDAGGQYKREGSCTRRAVKKGGDSTGGHYRKKGWCRRRAL